MRLSIVQPLLGCTTETFITAHAEHLPAEISVIQGGYGMLPEFRGRPVLSQHWSARIARKLTRQLTPGTADYNKNLAYTKVLRQTRPDVVLAEYGETGVDLMAACSRLSIPFVVHCHGHDASQRDTLARLAEGYRAMFQSAAAVVAVSTAMHEQLIAIGACPTRTHLNVYGIDCARFQGANPIQSNATFVAVGRFVDKKAPHLLLMAFHGVLQQVPTARLRWIGDGPLFGSCRDLAKALQMEDAVTFLGSQPHDVVANEMRQARAFVQHSIEAENGDSEGTPLAILEAGASGIPVISTRHAGIPDVVRDGETGLLVDEKDIESMTQHMIQLAHDASLASQLGAAAQQHISVNFTLEKSIDGLHAILANAATQK